MGAPDRERVRRVAAGDEDDVLLQREPAQVRRGPREELQVRRLDLASRALVPGERRRRVFARRRRNEQQASPARELEHVTEECLVGITAHRDDLALRHDGEI